MSEIADDIRAMHRQVADDLVALGAGAPSGAGEWTTADLVAHLVSQTGLARYALAVGRWALAHGINPGPRRLAQTNDTAVRIYSRRDFAAAVDTIRPGPPFPLLRPSIAPLALFEIWVHGDDLRRANNLGLGLEPATLALSIDSVIRIQKKQLKGETVDRSAPPAELMRWLVGRPSSLPAHVPPLSI